MGRPNPCFNCTDKRHEACHADCIDYGEWKSEREAAKAAMRRDYGYDEYQSLKTIKINKRNKGFVNRGGQLK